MIIDKIGRVDFLKLKLTMGVQQQFIFGRMKSNDIRGRQFFAIEIDGRNSTMIVF
jgi:hypothetical protein